MKFLCFGVGAIGTYIGGSLALSGNQVIFIEKPEFVAEIRARGLHLTLQNRLHDITQPVVVGSIDEALEIGHMDAAIFAVKSFDTQSAAAELTRYREVLPPFICLQNGVENEAVLGRAIGEDRVIPGTVTSAVGRLGPGEIVLERLRGVGLSASHPLSEDLKETFSRAGLNARLYANPMAMKWSKMLTNLLGNATSAILDLSPAEIFSDRALFSLEMGMLQEALNVMAALRIPVVGLPGTPIDWLVRAARVLPTSISQPLLRKALGSGRGGKMPSFHIDLAAGRKRSEVEFLNGAVVRFGEKVGVPTPINKVLTQTLLGLVTGQLERQDYSHHPEALFFLINKAKEQTR